MAIGQVIPQTFLAGKREDTLGKLPQLIPHHIFVQVGDRSGSDVDNPCMIGKRNDL